MARLWDLRSKEMWRSMAVDKAEELFREGGWTALYVAIFVYLTKNSDRRIETSLKVLVPLHLSGKQLHRRIAVQTQV